MKPFFICIFFSFLCFTDTTAQKRKTFKINPGEKIVEKVPHEELYSYPEFTEGSVFLRNNTYFKAKLNYNALFGEMQFIGPAGDSISIGDEKMIKMIIINTDTFYYSEGYLKLVLDQGEVKLANKRFIEFINREQMTGMGSTSVAIETYGKLSSSSSNLKDLIAMEILTLGTKNVLYIGDQFNNFKEATKKNVLDIYAKKGKQVEKYLKENKLKLTDEEDLKKLVIHFTSGE